jgi:hypothetical protein
VNVFLPSSHSVWCSVSPSCILFLARVHTCRCSPWGPGSKHDCCQVWVRPSLRRAWRADPSLDWHLWNGKAPWFSYRSMACRVWYSWLALVGLMESPEVEDLEKIGYCWLLNWSESGSWSCKILTALPRLDSFHGPDHWFSIDFHNFEHSYISGTRAVEY